MTEQTPGRPMRADARANRKALIEAARKMYAERGWSVPLSAIAQEAGVGIGTLYRHFPSAMELVTALLSHTAGQVMEVCDRAVAEIERDAERGWEDFARELAALQVGALMPRLADGLDIAELPAPLEELSGRLYGAIGRAVDAAKRAGLVRDDAAPDDIYLGLGALSRPLPERLVALKPGLAEWLLHTYLRGLRPGM